MSESLFVVREGPLARVVLSRPHVRNAFDAELIAHVKTAFDELAADATVRVVVLSGEGPAFCGGADVRWMRASLELDRTANIADASALSRMFRAIDRCPKLVVARVQGAALGGGCGLLATCDVVVAASDARFGFTETTLGILPSVISPFVLAKIGPSHARALALTGERFDARRALAIGLVHEVVAEEELDAAVERVVRAALVASPTAVAATKALFPKVLAATYEATLDITAAAIAEQRTSIEGQDGLRAFLEKRTPAWRS